MSASFMRPKTSCYMLREYCLRFYLPAYIIEARYLSTIELSEGARLYLGPSCRSLNSASTYKPGQQQIRSLTIQSNYASDYKRSLLQLHRKHCTKYRFQSKNRYYSIEPIIDPSFLAPRLAIKLMCSARFPIRPFLGNRVASRHCSLYSLLVSEYAAPIVLNRSLKDFSSFLQVAAAGSREASSLKSFANSNARSVYPLWKL